MLALTTEPSLPPDAQPDLDDIQRRLSDLEGVPLTFPLVGASLLADAGHLAHRHGVSSVVFDREPAGPETDLLASAAGYRLTRDLLQLRRPLPTGLEFQLTTRPFRPGEDDAAWLDVNNRAFQWHPDQSGWTLDDLHRRMAEPWFDPDGFLLHLDGGEIAGFCWTKVHADHRPPLGEIHVIGVDPDHQGKGLGRQLTLAGLDWLARHGLAVGMLYVEADNAPALRLYRDLGFGVHHHHRWYTYPLDLGV